MELFLLAGLWFAPVPTQVSYEMECSAVQGIVRRLIQTTSVSQAVKIEVYRELKQVTPVSCQVDVIA